MDTACITCVHAWAVHVLSADWEVSMARLVLNCVASSVPTEDVSEYWAKGRRLLPHVRRFLESIHRGIDVQPSDNRNICKAIHKLGCLYFDQGKMQEAEAMYRRALEGKEKARGPEHTLTVTHPGVTHEKQNYEHISRENDMNSVCL